MERAPVSEEDNNWFDVNYGKKARMRLFLDFWRGFSDIDRAKFLTQEIKRLSAGSQKDLKRDLNSLGIN